MSPTGIVLEFGEERRLLAAGCQQDEAEEALTGSAMVFHQPSLSSRISGRIMQLRVPVAFVGSMGLGLANFQVGLGP